MKQKNPEVGDKLIMRNFYILKTTRIKKLYKNGNFVTEMSNTQYRPCYTQAGDFTHGDLCCEPFTQERYNVLNKPFVKAVLINRMYELLRCDIYEESTYECIVQLLEGATSKAPRSQ